MHHQPPITNHPKSKKPPGAGRRAFASSVAGKSGLQRLADLVGHGLEGDFVSGHRGQDLAVQLDTGLAEAVHELRIGKAFQTRGGVDALDPQGAERALLVAAVAVGVLAGTINGGLGGTDGVLAAAVETLGLLENLLVSGVGY